MPVRFAASLVHSASLWGSPASCDAIGEEGQTPGSSNTPRQPRCGMPPEPCIAIGMTYSSKLAARMAALSCDRVWIDPLPMISTTPVSLRRNSARSAAMICSSFFSGLNWLMKMLEAMSGV